jgi:4-hydroxy-4-methyl-2-oxoglutarate aldolase
MTTDLQTEPLTLAHLEALKEFDTPTVANALELVDPGWDRMSGLMAPRIRALFPEKQPLVGYASTLLFSTRQPAPTKKLQADWPDYWRYVLSVPEPRVSVGQDLDPAPASGSLWGEVQTNIHMALGCVGAILEGAMRDLGPLQALDFGCFARDVVVGHAHAHLVDFGHTVEVGGVLVRSGDLIHADLHGVLVIPRTAAPQLAEACRRIVELERPLIAVCQDRAHFTLDYLIRAYEQFEREYPVAAAPTI